MRRGFFNETGFQASLLQDKVINKTCKKVGVSGGKWIKITYFSILNTKRVYGHIYW
jgi:hypothetical protein